MNVPSSSSSPLPSLETSPTSKLDTPVINLVDHSRRPPETTPLQGGIPVSSSASPSNQDKRLHQLQSIESQNLTIIENAISHIRMYLDNRLDKLKAGLHSWKRMVYPLPASCNTTVARSCFLSPCVEAVRLCFFFLFFSLLPFFLFVFFFLFFGFFFSESQYQQAASIQVVSFPQLPILNSIFS